ncbi:MAG: hypothetical protein ACF8PN_07235 [Phycisphaerales bacterium]
MSGDSGRFIPRADAAALAMLKAFADGIEANPALYMLTPPDAAAIRKAVDAFEAAYRVAKDERTRTKVAVAAKDDARRSAEQIVRQFAGIIKANAGVSDPAKIAIGIRPRGAGGGGTPIGEITSSPLLRIIGATPGAHTLRYADANTPERSAKPFGAANLQLFCALTDDAPEADPPAARFIGAYTRNPIGVEHPHADDGKVATYYARWATRKGVAGPWSNGISMRVAA